ncbi:hypothetical protein GP486_001633 [Trichoglossum hirsutum]|uniref:ML-like domain-containing protein n=1 Tax=Trichoglossum hirsutum TaxID=265104 RepID=A0A9P8LFS0_9PEZI|nr:hypothetical protein GP486_001633 [Trichoglossum hirsutum]
MTVLFHLVGATNIKNESLMSCISVSLHVRRESLKKSPSLAEIFPDGEARFDLTFNPCNANIASLCPMKGGVPIQASGIIPIAPSDVSGFPKLAFTIPDFEGQAIIRIFANSTRREIACYSAVVTNGASFSHPEAVGSILGIFTVVAVIASFTTAIYGSSITTIRKHYAHSLSIFVVFSVFQHIYFSGALSLNWPSVLVAFWSNYAWSGGIIYGHSMQNSINQFLGENKGNASMVGAAGSSSISSGDSIIHSIYKRTAARIYVRDLMFDFEDILLSRRAEHALAKRAPSSNTTNQWFGSPVAPGLPLPGNFSGFAGTLSQESVPQSNVFMTGFLWYLIVIFIVVVVMIVLKGSLEALSSANLIRKDRLSFYRAHWLSYTGIAVLRTFVIGFFAMVFLAMFQFTLPGSAGAKAIAAIVFVTFLGGLGTVAAFACYCRLRFGHYQSEPDRLNFERKKVWGIPWFDALRESQRNEKDASRIFSFSVPWWRIHFIDDDPHRTPAHEDEGYISKFGWLAARFRRTRWWFFAVWLGYEFIRACFYAAAQTNPMAQVFGLLVVEIVALIAIIACKPFESSRLNALMVYLLGFSKVATLALSVAFDVRFNLNRITTTAIGVVIIVIQGVLTITLLIFIVVGAISSYFSITRNREEIRPKSWLPLRDKYLEQLDKKTADLPPPPPPEPAPPVEPYFSINTIKRVPKIADEDPEFVTDLADPTGSKVSVRRSRANSIASSQGTVPFGGYVHRTSWNTSQIWSTEDSRNPDNQSRTGGSRSSNAPLVVAGPGPAIAMTPLKDPKEYQQPVAPSAAAAIPRGPSPLSRGDSPQRQQRVGASD